MSRYHAKSWNSTLKAVHKLWTYENLSCLRLWVVKEQNNGVVRKNVLKILLNASVNSVLSSTSDTDIFYYYSYICSPRTNKTQLKVLEIRPIQTIFIN